MCVLHSKMEADLRGQGLSGLNDWLSEVSVITLIKKCKIRKTKQK